MHHFNLFKIRKFRETVLRLVLIDVFCFCSSYLHCEWKTEKELMKDKRIAGKIRRYKLKKAQMNNYFSTVSVPQQSNLLYSYRYHSFNPL